MKLKVLLVVLLLTFFAAFAQIDRKAPPQVLARRPLARLSYRSTYGIDRSEHTSPSICFRVEKNGDYRISRLTERGMESYEGSLTSDQMSVVNDMLKGLERVKQSRGGAVYSGSEGFVAELDVNDEEPPAHVRWINPDHRNPFPESITRVVDWLQSFTPPQTAVSLSDSEGKSTDPILRDPSICPMWAQPAEPQSATFECPSTRAPAHDSKPISSGLRNSSGL